MLNASSPLVASVPAGHVYVRHLARPEPHGTPSDAASASSALPGARRLPDPDPADPDPADSDPAGPQRSTQQRWWPPMMLQPQWLAEADYDLVHLHFGFDPFSPEQLRGAVEQLRRRGRPLVFTVHDLRNPHHASRRIHDAQLDVLVPAADTLITLTDGAADEIAQRWGRAAEVVPHPHVVDFATATTLRDGTLRDPDTFRVGLHLKSLRAGMDPHRVLPMLVATMAELPDAVLQVDGHCDVLAPGGDRFDRQLSGELHDLAERGLIDLRVHDYFSDTELWRYLASLDASVLPYRFGTHSGWLEACRDLGTEVIVSDCGHYADQGPVRSYHLDGDDYDADSLRRAVVLAWQRWRDQEPLDDPGAEPEARRRQRTEIAARHEAVYRTVLGR